MGEGAYYAPELTKVIERRGEGYVKAVLTSKTSWAPRGRKRSLRIFRGRCSCTFIEYLTWIGNTD